MYVNSKNNVQILVFKVNPCIPNYSILSVSIDPQLVVWVIKPLIMLMSVLMVLNISACDHNKTDSINSKTNIGMNAVSQSTLNVVSPDWGNTATLTAMGHPPLATGEIRLWNRWVGQPKLPDSVVDLGIRSQPNHELVAQLPVDMIVDNILFQNTRALYGDDIPAESVSYLPKNKTAKWSDYTETTRKLGEVIGNSEMAENYIINSEAEIAEAGRILNQRYPHAEKFAVVQFVDVNNVRMYVENSLFQPALHQMDKQLISSVKINDWGFVPITMVDLAKLDSEVCLLVVEPISPITRVEIEKSLIWQRLDYGNTRCIGELSPVWIYGGMASLVTLANNLAQVNLRGGVAL